MKYLADLPIILHMIFPRSRGGTHQERLDAFYRGQAKTYDAFRRKLLYGREELLLELRFPPGGVWYDMGSGTGSNAEYLGERLYSLQRVVQVDLCPSLLEMARRRKAERGWSNVDVVGADATTWRPEDPADVVTFSYSLTMIPDWFLAIDRAWENLKPGGLIGVVDFYISRKWPEPDLKRHTRFQRLLWPLSYAWDDVFLSRDHLPYLRSKFEQVYLGEYLGRVPYMGGLRSPYYVFIGRKRPSPTAS
jgi:S-adenosylmethionine-diacylgycerolhomoserine-N-methlytransferase